MSATDSHAASVADASEKAAAILREDAPRTAPEQAALAVLEDNRWVLWHAHDRDLGVIRLLSRAGLLRDKAEAERQDRSVRAAMASTARERQANAVMISTLDGAIEQAGARLDAGEEPADVAAWLRLVQTAASRTRDAARSEGR